MKIKILASIAACAVAVMTSVTAFAASSYNIPSDKVSAGNVDLVGKNGIYSSVSELSGLTGITLTASANYDVSSKSSELAKPSGTFQVICDGVEQNFIWTVETGDGVVFELNDGGMYEATITDVSIPSDSKEVKLVFENDNETNGLSITGITLRGVSEPQNSETQEPPKGSSDIVSEEPSSSESSKVQSSSSKTETSSDSVKDETDNSNKPTGVGTGLAFAGIAIAAAAVVSLKKSK